MGICVEKYPLIMIAVIVSAGIVATISCYGYYYTYIQMKNVVEEISHAQSPPSKGGISKPAPTPPPSYSPDVVIYQEQKNPQNYHKALMILLYVFIGFAIAFLVIKLGAKAFKVLLLISVGIALTYTLHGLSFRRLPFWLEVGIAATLAALFIFWRNYKFRNLVGILFSGGIAALFGSMLYPYIWAPILAAFAIYDYLAVKSGKMISLAENAVKEDLPLLIRIETGKESHYVGFGDLVFPFIMTTSLLRYLGLWAALLSWTGIGVAMAILPRIVEKKGPQAGLPYLIPGSFLGLLAYLVAIL